MTVVPRAPGPASENLQGRKPREKGRDRAVRSAYGDLRAARKLNGRRLSTAVGLEHEHNLDVTARILLNGDLSFRALCNFKELGVAKISRATTRKL